MAEPSVATLLPDGNTMALGSANGHVLLWDLADGQPLRDWDGHDDRVTALAASFDGQTLVTGSFDCTAKVWSAPNGTLQRELRGHNTPIVTVAISADGQRALTGSIGMPMIPGAGAINLAGQGEDQTLRLWSIAQGTQLAGLEDVHASITQVAAVDQGSMFASASLGYGGEPNGVQIWEGSSGTLLESFARSAGMVLDLAAARNEHRLVLGGQTSRLFVWDIDSDQPVSILDGDATLSCVAISDDGATILAGTDVGDVVCWKADEDRAVRTLVTGDRAVTGVALDLGGSRVWSGETIRTGDIGARWYMDEAINGGGLYPLRLWDIPTGLQIDAVAAARSPLTAMSAARGADVVVTASLTEGTTRWNTEYRSPTLINAEIGETVVDLDITDDGGLLLLSAGADIILYDLTSQRVLRTLRGHEDTVRSAIFVLPRSAVASAADDGTLRLWDLDTGDQILILDHPDAGISQVAASGDGRWLMCGTLDGARVWDLESPLQPVQMFGHDGRVNAVCLSRDGSIGASGGDDGTVRIWHCPSGRELHALRQHDAAVTRLAFATNDRLIVSCGLDGTVKILDFQFGSTVAQALKPAQDAFGRLASSRDDAPALSVLGSWFATRGDWYRASSFYQRARWADPDAVHGLDAARSHWAAGMSFEALNELNLLPQPQQADSVVRVLREVILRDVASDLSGQLRRPGAGAAELMLDEYPEIVSVADLEGRFPLHVAVEYGHLSTVEMLLERGAPVNTVMADGSKRTALHLACATGAVAIIGLLLDRGADVRARTSDGWTALLEAVNVSLEVVSNLLARGADPNNATSAGYTPLHRAAGLKSPPEIIDLLLAAGASVSAVDDGGLTALHFAASGGEAATVRRLLDRGADPAVRDHKGRTPLDIAEYNGWEAVEALLQRES
jgi:WD40 repeat protein/ankyrin repeat protein